MPVSLFTWTHARISGRTCTQRNETQHTTTQHYTTQRQKGNEDCPGFLNSTGRLGPKRGGNATSPLHSRGSPNKGGQNQNWLPHPCLLGGPKEGGNATPPLHSRGAPNTGDKIRSGHQKRNEDCPGFLNSTGRLGPKRGWKCYVTPTFSGVAKQRGTKPELAASPLPSRGPKRGRKCYVTPGFSGSPKQRGTKSDLKTYARGNNDACSISKYGSLVRAHAQTVALR